MMKTNAKRKNSAMKKLVPAAGMLALSASMLATSTYAWFTMNKTVEVKGMQVKAQAEAGLLINEVKTAGDDYWDESATALVAPGTALLPTSTTNAAKWFHANSRIASDEAGASANTASGNLAGYYEELALTSDTTDAVEGVEGTRHAEYSINYINNNGTAKYQANTTDNAYYIMYKYYMRVSKDGGLSGLAKTENAQNVAIKKVDVTLPESQNSPDLNKALRVGVKLGGKMYIYAPVYGAGNTSTAYYATTAISNTTGDGGVITAQAVTNQLVNAFAKDTVAYTALTTLPGLTGDGTEVDIYVWFEGEDENCKTENITDTLDNIEVSVTFGLETLTAANATTAAAVGTEDGKTVKNEF
jgi:hypothetical protein